MSAATAPAARPSATPARGPEQSPATRRPRTAPAPLRVVRAVAPARSALPAVAGVLLVLVLTLVATLVLNAQTARTAMSITRTRVEIAYLEESNQELALTLAAASSSHALVERATALGMVPAGVPGVIDLGTRQLTPGSPAEATEQAAPAAG